MIVVKIKDQITTRERLKIAFVIFVLITVGGFLF